MLDALLCLFDTRAYDEILDVMQFVEDFGLLRYPTESLLRSLQLSKINLCRNEPAKFN